MESYLFPETRTLLAEIESRIHNQVMLRKVYNSPSTWQVRKTYPWHIDMPERDEGNIVCFTHELLHIYFDFCLGMKLWDNEVLDLVKPYDRYFKNEWHLANYFVNLINHLQHHKMIPYFEAYHFPMDKIVDNYYIFPSQFDTFENNLKAEFDLKQPVHRYSAALSYANFLCSELFFPNPEVREEMIRSYSHRMDGKFVGLRSIFEPPFKKWATDFHDLRDLLFEINKLAKAYAEQE